MKNIFILILLAVFCMSILLGCGIGSGKSNFAEFEINDVSQAAYFMDSVSAYKNSRHTSVTVKITGTIDSAATINYASYPENYNGGEYQLEKGEVNINTHYDYYMGDVIWIKFTPKGSKKGNLKIQTRIN